ncbi:MAG: glycosyltransferase [Reyranellaceae bacterium]
MNARAMPPMAMVLLIYRQERFVREALRGALAQDYQNLEIVVSDDASPDGTWRIVEEEASRYRGPHRLILNRNATNLGLMGNLLAAVRLTRAPYLVLAAGDDVSEPGRVRRMAETFAGAGDGGAPVTLVISNATTIDGDGRPFAAQGAWPLNARVSAEEVFAKGMVIGGAGSAYAREVFDEFPEPDRRIYNEDAIFCQRAALMGRIEILHDRLLRYRRHGGNISTQPAPATAVRQMRQQILDHCPYWRRVLQQQHADARWAVDKGLVDAETGGRLLQHMQRHLHNLDMTERALGGQGWTTRFGAVLRQRGEPMRRQLRLLLMAVAPRFYLAAMKLRAAVRGRA